MAFLSPLPLQHGPLPKELVNLRKEFTTWLLRQNSSPSPLLNAACCPVLQIHSKLSGQHMLTAQFLISRHWQWSDGANIRRVCNCTCLGMEQWIVVGSQEGSERIFQAKRARASAQGGAWYKRVQGEETNVAGMEISF